MIVLAIALLSAAPTVGPIRLSQRQLDDISDRCSTPRAWLWSRHGEIHIQPSETAKFTQVECLLGRLKRRHAGYLGFEGNERAN